MGLYQCKQIVEAHRETIQIRNAAGKGMEVMIELPLAPTTEHQEVMAAREA